MFSQSLAHQAWLTATDITRSVPDLTDEQRQKLLPLVYDSARKGIGDYAENAERMDQRLRPTGGGS